MLTGGALPVPFLDRSQGWGPTPRTPRSDTLAVTATGVRTVTVDARRAGVTCGARVTATTDGPLSVVLAGCSRTLRFG